MNLKEREKFITELIENIKRDILKENPKYPDSWDGIELRERIKDVFSRLAVYGTLQKRRIKDYKNYCLVEGLI